VISALQRVVVPDVFHETLLGPDVAGPPSAYRHIEAAVDRLTWPDVPDRVMWRALIAMSQRPIDPSDDLDQCGQDPAHPLAMELLHRAAIANRRREAPDAEPERPATPTRQTVATSAVSGGPDPSAQGDEAAPDPAAELLVTMRQAFSENTTNDGISADITHAQPALAALLGPQFLLGLGSPTCDAHLVAFTGPHSQRALEVRTDETRTDTLDQLWPCLQPLNWPHCNHSFKSVKVLRTTFDAAPSAQLLSEFGVIADGEDLTGVSAFFCTYEEVVWLPGIVEGESYFPDVAVTTLLDCIEWQRHDAAGDLAQVGMAYRHSNDPTNHVVDVDEGFAIIELDIPSGGPPQRRMRSLKRISFWEAGALTTLSEHDVCEIFCDMWTLNYELTEAVCADRHVYTPDDVETLSNRPLKPKVGKAPPSTGAGGQPGGSGGGQPGGANGGQHWLPTWLDHAERYWQDATSVGFREFERLEERRQSTDPTRPENVFYDALEVWEANRRSLNTGLKLTIELWEHMMEGLR
jgi:hypothetical protein